MNVFRFPVLAEVDERGGLDAFSRGRLWFWRLWWGRTRLQLLPLLRLCHAHLHLLSGIRDIHIHISATECHGRGHSIIFARSLFDGKEETNELCFKVNGTKADRDSWRAVHSHKACLSFYLDFLNCPEKKTDILSFVTWCLWQMKPPTLIKTFYSFRHSRKEISQSRKKISIFLFNS